MTQKRFNGIVLGIICGVLFCAMMMNTVFALVNTSKKSAEPQYVGMSADQLAQRISYDGNNRIQYVGECLARFQNQGNTEAWRIKLLTYEGVTDRILSTTWANRSIDFEFAWNLRATYTY